MIQSLVEFSSLIAQAPGTIDPEAGEFNVFLFMIVMVAVVAACVLAVIGIVLAVVIAATSGVLAFSGAAISASIVAAVRRSPSVGFTMFVIQLSVVAGAILGASLGLLYSRFHGLPLLNWSFTGLGSLVGSAVLALLGWASVRLWLGIWRQVRKWWSSRRNTSPAQITISAP